MRADFVRFVLGWRDQLQAVYVSADSAARKRERKQLVLAAMRLAYRGTAASFARRRTYCVVGMLRPPLLLERDHQTDRIRSHGAVVA